jgi:hypothetical protein
MFSSAHAYVQNCSSRMYGQIAPNPIFIRDFIAMWRKGDLNMPRGDFVLQPDDEVLAVVHAENATELAGLLGKPNNRGHHPE